MKEYTHVLEKYYATFLENGLNLKKSTVNHYLGALRYISKVLIRKGIVKNSIYEITDLDELSGARDILYADEDFIKVDITGHRMYSSGLNNYYRFAAWEDFDDATEIIQMLDVPVVKPEQITVEQKMWKRSNIIKNQVLVNAGFICEIDKDHYSFVAENTGRPYMEGHHTLPMVLQDKFDVTLDTYANIVCLCPMCHKRIHYGLKKDRKTLIHILYDKRSDRLARSGIYLGKEEFTEKILEVS